MEAMNNNAAVNHAQSLTQDSYADRIASKYLASLGAKNLVFKTKLAPATDKHPVDDILVNVSGVIDSTVPGVAGLKINVDFWPNRECTEQDKVTLLGASGEGRTIDDITIRYGIYRGVNPVTGEEITTVGKQPKVVEFFVDGKAYELSGPRKTFNNE